MKMFQPPAGSLPLTAACHQNLPVRSNCPETKPANSVRKTYRPILTTPATELFPIMFAANAWYMDIVKICFNAVKR